jgi:hypothetical protein
MPECGSNAMGGWSPADQMMRSLMERNQFLRNKVGKLREQKQRQTEQIGNIVKSEEWLMRHPCGVEQCCHNKYLQLLRVKSPFF